MSKTTMVFHSNIDPAKFKTKYGDNFCKYLYAVIRDKMKLSPLLRKYPYGRLYMAGTGLGQIYRAYTNNLSEVSWRPIFYANISPMNLADFRKNIFSPNSGDFYIELLKSIRGDDGETIIPFFTDCSHPQQLLLNQQQLNIGQIACSLSDYKLVHSSEYEKFLTSNQIEVVNLQAIEGSVGLAMQVMIELPSAYFSEVDKLVAILTAIKYQRTSPFLTGYLAKKENIAFLDSELKKLSKLIDVEQLKDCCKESTRDFIFLLKFIFCESKAKGKRISALIRTSFTWVRFAILITGHESDSFSDILSKDVKSGDAQLFEDFSRSEGVMGYALKFHLSLHELLADLQLIKKIVKRAKDMALLIVHEFIKKYPNDRLEKEKLRLVLREVLKDEKQIAKPLDVSGLQMDGFQIKEIIYLLQLSSAAISFKNCIFSRRSYIESGASRVFTIESNDTMSILELDCVGDRGTVQSYSLRDHRASCNLNADKNHVTVASMLVNHLNGDSKRIVA